MDKWTRTISTDSEGRFTHLAVLLVFQGTEMFNFAHCQNIHGITEILWKVALSTIKQTNKQPYFIFP